jgi:hypothetical protein
MPRRLSIWFNEHGQGWLWMGQLCLVDDRQIAIFPADPAAGEELTDLVDHAWVASGMQARPAWARIWLSFREGAARHVLAEEATGGLIEECDRFAG